MKSLANIKENKLPKEIIEHLKKSEEEIARGEGIEADMMFKELKEKYGY